MLHSMLMSRFLMLNAVVGLLALLLVDTTQAQGLLGEDTTRRLAPGVLTSVPPNIDVAEGVVYPRRIPGLNIPDYTPSTFPASETLKGQLGARIRYHDVWQLDFAFKSLRHMTVELPVADGRTQQAVVWYMVYRVRNLNKQLSWVDDEERGGKVPNLETPIDQLDSTSLPGRFFPSFLLEGWVEEADQYSMQAYRDTVLPQAVEQIAVEERLNGKLLDNVEIAKRMMEPATQSSEGVWGVATWLDVDPRINFVTVSVQGLSSAFRSDLDGDEDGETHQVKTLQINFWRPGDADLQGDVFRPGILIDGRLPRQLSLAKKYRLPGPDLTVYRTDPQTLVTSRIGRVSADYDLDTLESSAITELTNQQVPASLADFLKKYGFENAENYSVQTSVEPSAEANMGSWTLTDPDGVKFSVQVEPIVWRAKDGKMEFVGGLDYFWDYRYIH